MLVVDDRAHDAETTPDEVLRIRDEIIKKKAQSPIAMKCKSCSYIKKSLS